MLLPEGEPRWVSPCKTLLTKISFGWKKKSHEVKEWFLRTEAGDCRPPLRVDLRAIVFTTDRLTLRLASNSSSWIQYDRSQNGRLARGLLA